MYLELHCHRGEAEVRILEFKTTWSEFQKSSQTDAEQGKGELRKLNFKTTSSEFQKPKQNVAPNSITSPLLVVLELNIYGLALPCS